MITIALNYYCNDSGPCLASSLELLSELHHLRSGSLEAWDSQAEGARSHAGPAAMWALGFQFGGLGCQEGFGRFGAE